MNFNVFVPKCPISAQFEYNFSRQTYSGAGIACFCHSLVTSLVLSGCCVCVWSGSGGELGVELGVEWEWREC